MSNDDTNETTGARLTEAQLAWIRDELRTVQEYQQDDAINRQTEAAIVACYEHDVHALLADRAALVAEIARLQAQVERDYAAMVEAQEVTALMGVALDQRDTALAQVAAMRPLVEALADNEPISEDSETGPHCLYCDVGPIDLTHKPNCAYLKARALVATSQTPAAPEGDDA